MNKVELQKRKKIRKEIVELFRGFYFVPIFLNLHKLKILDKFSQNSFTDLKRLRINNTLFLKKILDYLVRLDLFEKKNEKYKLTRSGFSLRKRMGTMYILNSYRKIFDNFEFNLKNKVLNSSWCDRKDNIIGSGLIHTRKFFEPSLNLINLKKVNNLLDIGCGDGAFLNVVKKNNHSINILGCDLSSESVKQTKLKLSLSQKKKKNIFKCNGNDILQIKEKLLKAKVELDENSIISMWFLLHEISNNSSLTIVKYLKQIKKNFPKTPILIGEISKLNNQTIKNQKSLSIMPEFYLFHELSGQGLLSEKQFLQIFKDASYKLKKISRTDNLDLRKNNISSNFICLIEPKKS